MTAPRHDGFTVHRRLPGRPGYAFRFFAEPEMKKLWTNCHPDWAVLDWTSDFRIGGADLIRMQQAGGPLQEVRFTYYDIRPAALIAYGYGMQIDGRPLSASVVSVEFRPDGDATLLVWTEQVMALADASDPALLNGGTGWALDTLVALMERMPE